MTADLAARLQAALGDAYLLERELGGGGMSRVFLAEERRLGRRVVVKVLEPALAAGVSADRFEREIRFAARLQDPRIVPLLTAGHAAGLSYYTMPFVEGESLRARIARGPVPLAEAIGILRDVALALDSAHAHQVAHRDIKPENVLCAGRTAVVTDFGIAKAIAAATEGSAHETMTTVGTVIGTPAYMAPEQVAGDPVDQRADIYAWGVVAHELLAGTHPFASRGGGQAVMAAHIAERPTPLTERAPTVPAPLAAIVDRALEKDPSSRPANAGELLTALDAIAPVTTASPPVRRRVSWAAVALAACVVAGVAGAGIVAVRQGGPGAPSPALRSLAVLPFTSPDRDSANAYFGAGMAEELTTAFARVPGIRVASRGSASRFQDAGSSDAEIARRLDVQAILEGTVRRAGDRIRVAARLVEPIHGTVLWADVYDRHLADVFDLQDEMAHAIVAALRPAFGDTAQLAGARAVRGTADLVAYDLFLKGRYYWSRRGADNLRTAIAYFERALARDSGFARAWAGLSMAQVVLPYFTDLPADSLLAAASRNAGRALALDSTLADAHLARGYALKGEWRWSEADAEFRRALALAPDDATIRHWYGVMLYVTGRLGDGLAELSRAVELDPLSVSIATDHEYVLYIARRYDEALTEGRRAAALEPTRSDIPFQDAMIEIARGRPDSAIVALERARRLGSGFDVRGYLSAAYRQLGNRRTADSIAADVRAASRGDPAVGYSAAIAATRAGDPDAAVAELARATASHSLFLSEISLPCDPIFDPLRGDPRFTGLLRGLGLAACGREASR